MCIEYKHVCDHLYALCMMELAIGSAGGYLTAL